MYRLHGFFTQNTMKTLYVLEELGVDYEFRFVDLTKGENKSESFQNMTPLAKFRFWSMTGSSFSNRVPSAVMSPPSKNHSCTPRTSYSARGWTSG